MEESLEGRTLGRYRVGRMLGAGGMGAVYAGVQEPLGRPVAVKVLRPELSRDADVVARFKREAELAATLSHPNIAQVTDFGVEEGRAFLVMDLLEGESLAALLEREGRLSSARVQRLGMQILSALAVAHERGVVHRDLKPENVFVQRAGGVELVKLLDFGIARMTEVDHGMTRTGAVIGTPAYMSPEQARGRRVDARSDVFSLGAVLYEMLAGARAFAGENYHELMFAVVEQTPTPLLQLDASIDRALAALVERAMNKTPEARFASAGEMRDALGAIEGLTEGAITLRAGSEGAPATRVGEPRRAHTPEALARTMASQPRPQRSRAVLWAIPIALGLVGAVGLGGWAAGWVAAGGEAVRDDAAIAAPAQLAALGEPMRPVESGVDGGVPVAITSGAPAPTSDPPAAATSDSPSDVGEGAPDPASGGAGHAQRRSVLTRCGTDGAEVEQPIVRRGATVYASSLSAFDDAARRDSTALRARVNERADAIASCYRGQPMMNGQWYTVGIEADGHVTSVDPIVFCPIEPAVVSCVRRALSDVVFDAADGPGRYRVGLEVRSGR